MYIPDEICQLHYFGHVGNPSERPLLQVAFLLEKPLSECLMDQRRRMARMGSEVDRDFFWDS